MEITQYLLNDLEPEQQCILGWKYPDKPFAQKAFKSVEDLYVAAHHHSGRGADVWFAVAAYDSSGNRKKENVQSLKALHLDLDVGEADNKYDSKEQALTGLRAFCQKTGLPKPTIIDSGYGYHVYWTFDERVAKEYWRTTAQQLKDAAAHYGLKADRTRTADSSSVLRIPQTFNYKGEPREVVQLTPVAPSSFDALMVLIGGLGVPKPEPKAATPDANAAFDIPDEFPPSSAGLVADGCAHIRAMRDTEGDIDEPDWYNCIGVLRHTTEGDDVIHQWSQGHGGYDEAETDRKIDQWERQGLGPTTCAQFQEYNPDPCKDCPVKGKITSPIQLGIEPTKPEPEPQRPSPVERPTVINGHWRVGVEGVWHTPDGDPPKKVLSEPIYIDRVGRLGYDDAIASVQWLSPTGNWHESEMSLINLTDDRSMQMWLLQHAITGFGKVKLVREYLKDYSQMLSQRREPDIICRKFGWSGGSFMIGKQQITKHETKPTRLAPTLPPAMVRGLVANGELASWTAATQIFQKPQYWMHGFGVLAAMAAPLFKLVDMTGAVLSLSGESGTGKTTAASFGLSTWGDPKALTVSPTGTLNSKGEFLRAANNLPLLVDDVGVSNKLISPLIYMAANGQAKERVTRSGTIKGQETWQTVMLVTTNSPILDLPESMVGEAERRRVLELDVGVELERDDAIKLNNAMKEHHGVAAQPLIEAIIRQQDALTEQFETLYQKYLANPEIPDANRFGVWLIAAAQVVGELAYGEEIIDFDPAPICTKALKSLETNAKEIMSSLERVEEAVNAFINSNIARISVREGRKWTKIPDREVFGAMDRESGLVIVPIHRLKSLMVEWNIPGSAFQKWREENEVDAKASRITRGGAPERCTIFKMPIELTKEIDDGKSDN